MSEAFDANSHRIDALLRAVKAIEVSGAPHLDDGTVLYDVRVKELLARVALLTDLLVEAGQADLLEVVILDDCIGEDLVLASLYRRLAALGVSRDQVFLTNNEPS